MGLRLARQVLVTLGVILVIAMSALATLLPLNGVTTGEIADRYDIYFLPAGYVFLIWNVIYAGLIAYAVFQFLASQKQNPRLAGAAPYFLVSCVANAGWLVLWHYQQFAWSVLAIAVLLISLILVYLRLEKGRTRVSAGEVWAVRVPFSIYLGWVSVATIANITQVLADAGWEGWIVPEAAWAVIMLVIAAILGGVMVWMRRDFLYALVAVWAFIGIGIRQSDAPSVAWTAYGLSAGLILAIVLDLALRPGRTPKAYE